METPTLRTQRLILRPATPEDLPFILKLYSRSETNRYSEYADIKTLAEAEQTYERFLKQGYPNQFRVVAELRETGEPVGTIGLYQYSEENHRAELGYDLLKDYWGRGLMTEAVREILHYAFSELGLNRVEAATDSENEASVRVLERTGFTLEGRLRERLIYMGSPHDEFLFGLLAEDWRKRSLS